MPEKPKPFLVRLYKKERDIVRGYSRKYKMSKATIIRAAILMYDGSHLDN